MRQTTPPPAPISPQDKLRFKELNAELRDLKSQESLADYERVKGVITEGECFAIKERIQEKFQKILNERNSILNSK